MPDTTPMTLPHLECRPLPALAADNLEAVRAAFQGTNGHALRQSWLAKPEEDFTPGIVRVGWRGNSLLVFAELEDADIFTRATADNQRMWELGDTFEIFLQPADSPGYTEFHITPNNRHLQLRFPDGQAARRAQAANLFDELLLQGAFFHSRTWVETRQWFIYAEIPALAVCGVDQPPAGTQWRFSFSRYDYIRSRREPIISSSSPHSEPDFHRREEWGTLHFVSAAKNSSP
jgi:hypothetical protein